MTLRNTAVVLVVLSFALSPAFGQVWASKELDSGTKDEGFEWPYPSLRVNNDGDVFISYYHDKDSTVKVARWSEQGWSTETVGSSNGGYTSLDLDPYGRPRIAYESDGDIRYAWRSGSNWQTQGLGSGSLGANSALAVDSDGKAHIVCSTASGLKYMRGAGSQAWESDTVDTGNLKGASIELDAAGEAHFSYQAHLESDVEIRYAKHNSSPWDIPFEITTVGSTESLGLTSICLTEGNVPHIAYRTDGFT
ncbi:MAG: hypothetical protein ACOC9S_04330, partial [Planctomycetota bacterium]